MQVTSVPKEENKAWAGRCKALGGGGAALPTSLGTWETHRSSLEACDEFLLCVCVCVCVCVCACAQPRDISLGDPGPPKPVLFSDPRRQWPEVGCVLSLGQVNGWDMTMVTHDQARKRLTKRSEEVVRLLVTRQSLQKAVQQSMLS